MKVQRYQIREMLQVANENLVYCKVICDYPKKFKKNFYPQKPFDQFYKNICNNSFNEALIVISSLLSNDNRVISLWNWDEYISKRQSNVESFFAKYETSGLKTIRDQLSAHIDRDNRANTFPGARRRGVINEVLINALRELLDEIIDDFMDFTKSEGDPHSPQVFQTERARNEIEGVLEKAPPELTEDHVI